MDFKSKWGISSTSSKSCSGPLDSELKQSGKQPPMLRMTRSSYGKPVIVESTYVSSEGPLERPM